MGKWVFIQLKFTFSNSAFILEVSKKIKIKQGRLSKKSGYKNPKFVAGKRYWSFLLKLDPDQPSPTIISSPGHWEGPFHWSNRRLRIKELAAIQTFPSDYIFHGSKFYNSEIPKLPGTASLMLDGGMVDTCIKAMEFMNQSF